MIKQTYTYLLRSRHPYAVHIHLLSRSDSVDLRLKHFAYPERLLGSVYLSLQGLKHQLL